MARNTIAMMALRAKHGAASLRNTNELRQFVEEWVNNGGGVESSGSELTIGDAVVPRFTLLSSRVEPWRVLDADCVRAEYVMEERDNPGAPDTVLILVSDGPVCHHPTAREYVVMMGISERYERGQQIDPNLFERLKSEYAEPLFRSLEFK